MGFQIKDFGLSKTIEAQVLNSVTTVVKFDVNDTSLDNMLVHGISLFSAPVTIAPSRRPILDIEHIFKGFITLVNENNNVFNQSLPLETFYKDPSGIIIIHPKLISVRNTYIELPQIALAPALPAGGASLLFTFFYQILDRSVHKLNEMGELVF